jgi:hypothetical protein
MNININKNKKNMLKTIHKQTPMNMIMPQNGYRLKGTQIIVLQGLKHINQIKMMIMKKTQKAKKKVNIFNY